MAQISTPVSNSNKPWMLIHTDSHNTQTVYKCQGNRTSHRGLVCGFCWLSKLHFAETLSKCRWKRFPLLFVAAHWNSMIPPTYPPLWQLPTAKNTYATNTMPRVQLFFFFYKLRTTQLWVCSYSEQESNALARPNECLDVPMCTGYFLMDCWLYVWFWSTYFPRRDLSVYIPRLL